MFIVITMAYLIFWGPLFIVTLANYTDDWKAAKKSMAHEVARSFPLTLLDLRNLGVMAEQHYLKGSSTKNFSIA